MEVTPRRRSVDDIDAQHLTSILLCVARILIVLQHLLLLVTPAQRPTGTYRGTYVNRSFYRAMLCKRKYTRLAILSTTNNRVSYYYNLRHIICRGN